MDFKEVQDLIKLINKSNLTEFKMTDGDFSLSIRTKEYSKGRSQIVQSAPQQVISSIPSLPMTMPAVAPVAAAEAPKAEAAPATAKAEEDSKNDESNYIEIKSPIVGTFYRSPSPDKPAYVKPGDSVEVGKVVCIVEAMKLFNEIESEVSGKIVKIMVEDASPVQFDQVLFLVDPKG